MLHEATNQVSRSGDVTACACPTCLGALSYAAPERVVHVATREQEGGHDEDARPPAARALPAEQGATDDPVAPFREWTRRHG